MFFGILHRYVIGEIVRAFLMALLTITGVFVLFMVMAEAARHGLSPAEIARLVPFVVPGSLPFTIPVALLFAVTVVFGRIASDNEVVAIKTAGLSAWTVLGPAMAFGLALSGILVVVSNDAIPRANDMAKKIIFKNLEDMFYKQLKMEREFNNPGWPFYIKARDVRDRTMIGAYFKHRANKGRENPNVYDAVITADEAVLRFDVDAKMARVHLNNGIIQRGSANPDIALIDDRELEIPLPGDSKFLLDKTVQMMTTRDLRAKYRDNRRLIVEERERQAMSAALWMATGRLNRIEWRGVHAAFGDYAYWEMECNKVDTEIQLRMALAWGSFFFVFLGAPVGILFARRDFLSAFISCFMPIIVLYYPLTLFGTNLGKEGIMAPMVALWLGNVLLGVLAAAFALPPVLKH